MTAMVDPSEDPRVQVPAYVALVRIFAVIGMSAAVATGICLLLLGSDYAVWGILSIAMAIPFFGLMRLVENAGSPPEEAP